MATDPLPPCLLTYLPYTWPSPIQISTDLVPASARVNITVSAATPVYCNKITVSVPVDETAATALFKSTPQASVSTNAWAPAATRRTGRELGLDNDNSYASFIFETQSAAARLIQDLGLGILGEVSKVIGDADILIQEKSGTTNDPSTFTDKGCTVTIRKAAPTFYLANLAATTPTTPTAPTTDFTAGTPIRFVWESNGTYFQIFAKGSPTPIYAGTDTTYTLRSGVTRDSTFVLVGSITGNAAQGGYQPIYLYDSLTITVSNPVLTPTSVEISGNLTGNGTTTLAGVTVNGALDVRDTTTLEATTVKGRLTAKADTILGDTTVTRDLTVQQGRVAMFGKIKALGSGTDIGSGYFTAKTDGFVLATVGAPPTADNSCFAKASVYVSSLERWFETLGGTVGSFGPKWSYLMQGNPGSLCVPIAAGEKWRYRGTNAEKMQVSAVVSFYWLPIGSNDLDDETVDISSCELDDAEIPEPSPLVGPDEFAQARSAAAIVFIERLEEFFENPLPANSREHLAGLLIEL
jgi:hypothetical protein